MASTIQIDRLLETTVRRNASDLHLAVGRPPTLRMGGHLRELQTKVLEPEDTTALMKSITPDRIQQEYEETGSGDFGFAYGDAARFRVAIFKQKGFCSLVLRKIPNKIRKAAIASGMKSLLQDGKLKVLNGITTAEEIVKVAQVEGVITSG